MHTIQAVAFDVDGTLYSEPLLYLRSIAFALRNRNTIRNFRTLRAYLHEPNSLSLDDDLHRWQISTFAKMTSISSDEAEQQINTVIYNKWISKASRMPLLAGVNELLHFLKQRDIPLAILSDFPPQRKLERWQIAGLFSVTMNTELCNHLKPHPRPFELLSQSLSLPPQSILYVGNNPHYDIQPAHRLGFQTAYYHDPYQWRRHTSSAPIPADTFVFNRYSKLHHFLERLLDSGNEK